jgi:hypothetical protein
MPLVATTIKLEPDKVELMKMKKANVSQVCRDAIDTYLKLSSNDKAIIKSQIADLQQKRNMIDLEIKLLLKQLEASEEEDVIKAHRESIYESRKNNLAYMFKTKSLDWHLIAEIFKFQSSEECKTWVLNRLREDELIKG